MVFQLLVSVPAAYRNRITVHQRTPSPSLSVYGKSIQAFIKRSKRAGFCNTELNDFDALCAKADNELFLKILNSPDHVLHQLLPPRWKYIDRTTDISQNAHLV